MSIEDLKYELLQNIVDDLTWSANASREQSNKLVDYVAELIINEDVSFYAAHKYVDELADILKDAINDYKEDC